MLSCNTDYLNIMPAITVYMNCDTILAINLGMFNLSENDEFVFTIKNYDHIDSPYVFLFKARLADVNKDTNEVIFTIPPIAAQQIKPCAFYNFAVFENAFDLRNDTVYKKLSENGKVNLKYGAQNFIVKTELTDINYEIVSMRLELLTDPYCEDFSGLCSTITGMRLEPIELEGDSVL